MWVSTPSPEEITASCVDNKSAKPSLDVKPEKSKRCFSVKEMETICENQITNNSQPPLRGTPLGSALDVGLRVMSVL